MPPAPDADTASPLSESFLILCAKSQTSQALDNLLLRRFCLAKLVLVFSAEFPLETVNNALDAGLKDIRSHAHGTPRSAPSEKIARTLTNAPAPLSSSSR